MSSSRDSFGNDLKIGDKIVWIAMTRGKKRKREGLFKGITTKNSFGRDEIFLLCCGVGQFSKSPYTTLIKPDFVFKNPEQEKLKGL